MSTPQDIANPMTLDLTVAGCEDLSIAPLVAGDEWTLRVQVRDVDPDDAEETIPVSLDGATVALTIKNRASDAAALVTRESGVALGSDEEIEIDADQATEDTTANTGKGWFTVRFSGEDETALTAAAGVRAFDIRVRFGDGTLRTIVRGRIEILSPYTTQI